MKRYVWIALFALTGSYALSQIDFKQEYALYDSLASDRAKLVYNGAITPLWATARVFCYETRDAGGVKYYKVDITRRTKTLCNEEDLIRTPERRRVERRDTVLSPDGKWNAFVLTTTSG